MTDEIAARTGVPAPAIADEKRVTELAAAIDFSDPSLSVTYGAEVMRDISRFADDILARVKSGDAGETGKALEDLMVKVKGIDVSAVGKKPGVLASLPLVGSLFNAADRTMARFNSASEQIEVISDKLEEAMVGLLRDIEMLEALYGHNEKFHDDLNTYLEAGRRRVEEARNTELPRLRSAAEASNDAMAAQKVRDFAEQINRLERRLHDLQLSRTITIQTAPQIRMIQSNDQTLAEKIQTSILSTIPIWKSQMVLALSLGGQRNAAAMQREVADTTNTLLRKNAEMLEQASVETAREVERSIVDIETLRDVQDKLVGTIEETLRIAREGREKRISVEKELAAMEQDLKTRLTSLAVKGAEDSLLAATETSPRTSPGAMTSETTLPGPENALPAGTDSGSDPGSDSDKS